MNVCEDDSDIYFLTETWLNGNFSDNEIFPACYNVFRNDRESDFGKSRGGGVLIAVKSKLSLITNPDYYTTAACDAIFVQVLYRGLKFIFGAIYIVPNAPILEYSKLFDFIGGLLDNLDPMTKVIFSGDLNLPDYVQTGQNFNFANISKQALSFLHFCSLHQLQHKNKVVNKNNRVLDVIVSNGDVRVTASDFSLVSLDAHHPCLDIEITARTTTPNVTVSKAEQYDFKKADFHKLYLFLEASDFSEVYKTQDVNTALSCFYSLFYNSMDACIPKKSSSYQSKYPIWFTAKILRHIKIKRNLNTKIRKNKRMRKSIDKLKLKLNKIRTDLKIEIQAAYKKHASLSEQLLKKDPKKLWNFTQDKLGHKSNIPDIISFEGVNYSEPEQIAEKFGEMFHNIFTNNPPVDLPDQLQGGFDGLPEIMQQFLVTEDEVEIAIDKLKGSKTIGPDGIPSYIVKGCKNSLIKPLVHIINLCFSSGLYPELWKVSRICPVPKKGDKRCGENFRGISILNSLSKVVEIILYDRLFRYMEGSISFCQHGFVPRRSTTSNLLQFTEFVSETLDNQGQVDVIYFDLQKAFDVVDHSILLKKLYENFEIPIYLLIIIKNYLSNRLQYVSFKGKNSACFPITSGVPQGCNLGPLMFIAFINDIVKNVISHALIYADDLKIFNAINCYEDCLTLQRDVDTISTWAAENRMVIHINKCFFVRFGKPKINTAYIILQQSIPLKNEVVDLGVTFNSQLSFKTQIINMVNKAFKILGFIKRIGKDFQNQDTFKTLYNSLVRSKLEYCCVIWNTNIEYLINEMEKVQRNFLRYLYFKTEGIYPHYKNHPVRSADLLLKFDYQSLMLRRKCTEALTLFKIVNNLMDCPCILSLINFSFNVKNVRKHNFLEEPRKRTQLSSPLLRIIASSNSLLSDTDICHTSFLKAKTKLKALK